ncbi:MAG: hypothetical protein LBS55_06570 [Prevotellaceae bacterium]|jgi:3'-phosphoadenosine 5'-phosphosulfate sulfotransferase (PAPS reductase)/FAD synthetase|nr:hypothetical protein [Prevotellaceae bacterium]
METSEQLCERIARDKKDVICSFSMGKDSIATYIQLKRHFERVHNVFYFMIPNLKFQRESLDYYEQKFGEKITVIPSPHWYTHLYKLMYQSPDRITAIDNWIYDNKLYIPTYDQLFSAVKSALGLSQDTYVGTGVRMNDSLTRRLTIKKYGAENKKRKQFFPVFDWNIEKVKNEIRDSKIKLPVDYKIWGRTFDGLEMAFLKGLKDNFPQDYETVKFWFPFVEMDFLRFRDFCELKNKKE